VERASEGREPKTQSGFRGKLKIVVRVMRVFLVGFGFTATSYGVLEE
jgi:hypothetical protein